MKIFEIHEQERMTVEAAEKYFYPNCVLMTRCTVDRHAPLEGYIAAIEEEGGDDYEALFDYRTELLNDPSNGKVFLIITKKPYEGEGLFIEYAE